MDWYGTLKYLIQNDWIDRNFVENYTRNFEALKSALAAQSWEELELVSGASRSEMLSFAKMVWEAEKAVFVWSMGITQHEDGEDNALDKLIGSALLAGELPLTHHLVMVSGCSSFEILQKCIAAGVPMVCAVSAPSSLAVSLAREFGIALVGFLRGRRFNVYSGWKRIDRGNAIEMGEFEGSTVPHPQL